MHVDEPFALEDRDDAWLIDRASRGDHLAYGELVRRYAAIAHRTATSIAGPADAEDAVQEGFVRAFYALGRFRAGSPFKPWLLAIVANCARNKVRPRSQQARLLSRLTGAPGAPAASALRAVESAESSALGARERQELARAVDALPESLRLVVACRYLLELSEAETAQVLGWPAGTVKSRLFRALRRLRKTLADGGPESAPESGERP
jgi:RNA polymerase sigma-70 factor (ECF subfamily)